MSQSPSGGCNDDLMTSYEDCSLYQSDVWFRLAGAQRLKLLDQVRLVVREHGQTRRLPEQNTRASVNALLR